MREYLPESFVDLAATTCARFTPLFFARLEGAGEDFLGEVLASVCSSALPISLSILIVANPANLIGNIGVDIQRGADRNVADDGGEGFYIHSIFQGGGRKGVAQIVEV